MPEKRGMNPMPPVRRYVGLCGNPNAAPRCRACTRAGGECHQPAMANRRRCRLHGGKSTGPTTEAGLLRSKNARLTHGAYSAEAIAFRRLLRTLKEKQKELVK